MRPNDRGFQHIAIIVSDMDQAYARLRRFGVEHASTGPQTLPAWNQDAAGISAFYFRDPDRHFLEILHFPAGKGLDKWHQSGRLFLGIDHTAIVVANTETSLAFYRDALGLRVVGQGENSGPEQERLNNVPGARLRITTLRAPAGPGIELLEYLAPHDGRPARDLGANDLAHWQTLLVAGDIVGAARALERRFTLIPPRVVGLGASPLGGREALLARDPDGHAVQIRAR